MTSILETDRLLLRQFSKKDAAFILKLLNSPGWLQYIGDRNVRTIEDAERYLECGPLKSYASNGFGLSCVVLKEQLAPIGMCGLIRRDILPYTDLGFAMMADFEGKGLMFEVATAYMHYARNHMNFDRVLGLTIPGNLRSISLLQRLGFTYRNQFKLPGQTEPLLLFRLDLSRN